MTNPILQEINGLSPGAKTALLNAHQSSTTNALLPSQSLATMQPPPMVAGLHAPSRIPAVPKMNADPMPPASSAAIPSQIAPKGTLPADENERGRLLASGSGVHQIKNPVLKGLAGVGNAIGSIVAPGLMRKIPGTEEHHNLLLGRNEQTIANDLGIEKQEATNAGLRAQVPLRKAEAALDTANAKKALQPDNIAIPTSGGYETYNPHEANPQLQPLNGVNGQPAMPYVKPGPEHAVTLALPGGKTAAGKTDDQGNLLLADGSLAPEGTTLYQKPGTIQAKTLQLPNGQQVAGKVDPRGNLLLEDGSPAPKGTRLYQAPSYGELILPTKTQEMTDPSTGLPVKYGYDVRTQRYDLPEGVAGTGSYADQIQRAASLARMVNTNVMPLLAKMSKAGENGPIKGRFEDWINQEVGNANPDIAEFHTLMDGVVRQLMGMYGMRRSDAVAYLANQLGARMTPESMAASLKGIVEHAHSIIGGSLNPSAMGENNSGGGSTERYEMNGKTYDIPANKVGEMLKKYPNLKRVQ